MSQNITLSLTDQADIAKIKPLLLQHKNQVEIATIIKKRRETVNRKIGRWMQTEDFDEWANTLWLEQYGELSIEDKREAFRQLTKLLCAKQTRRIETRMESYSEEHVIVDVTEDEDQILSKAAAILNRKTPTRTLH